MIASVTVGFRPPESRRESGRPGRLRILWRMQGPRHIVAAGLYEHPAGTELRVYFEPEDREDVLQTVVHRFDVGALEEHANALREVLRMSGWWPLASEE